MCYTHGPDPLPVRYAREGSGDLRALFVYRWNIKSRAKLTTYEVNKPALSPVAMVIGAKPQASQGTIKESHQRRRLFSEGSAAALIKLRHYSSNTSSDFEQCFVCLSVLDCLSPKLLLPRAENLLEVAITNISLSVSRAVS